MTTPHVKVVSQRRKRWQMMSSKQRLFAVINLAAAMLFLVFTAAGSVFERR